MRPRSDEPPVSREGRWFRNKEIIERIMQAEGFRKSHTQRVRCTCKFPERWSRWAIGLRQNCQQHPCRFEAVANVGKITRPSAQNRNARECTSNIWHPT